MQSPNEIMDSEEYVGVPNAPYQQSADQIQVLPRADNELAMRELLLAPLLEEPEILEDVTYTWTVKSWRSMSGREHSPIFQAWRYPWRILLYPYGNNVEHCSIYLEQAFEPNAIPENWSCCVQFALLLWNPNDPSVYTYHHAHHRFTKEESDWGFTRFVELRKMFDAPWEGLDRPLCENGVANISAYIRVVEDETGILWHNFNNYDSKKETGYVGLKNQGATSYLNTLIQSLYFTNAFRKVIYSIPTEQEANMANSVYTLQRLFYRLQTSETAVGTNELTKSFGWGTREIFEPQDIVEFSRVFLDRMEEKMKGTSKGSALSQIFSGKIKTYISCINIDYEYSRIEDFWNIQLDVSRNSDLFDSFKNYIQVVKMVGESQYFVDDQHKLQDANQGTIFMSFPDVLHLQLKRYKYDIHRDAMVKIDDRYEFPEVFDVLPYLCEDADKSEPWTYQLHGVIVHEGSMEAGHNYAFLKPNKNGWFYKFDDDKVTKATMREVLEGNFGGEYRPSNRSRAQVKKTTHLRQNSAYVLVYIRQCRLDKILAPVTVAEIPAHLRRSIEEELALQEAARIKREEAHLYIDVKVITEETFKHHSGADLTVFDANPEVDSAAPRLYKERRSTQIQHLVCKIATDLGVDSRQIRLWVMVNRQNRTIRPDRPIMDLRMTVEETIQRAASDRDTSLRVWAEVAEEVDSMDHPVWPTYQGQLTSAVVKNDLILLFLKFFDSDAQILRGAGHVYIGKEQKVRELVPLIMKKMGWDERLPLDEKILLWEEIKPTMIEALNLDQSLKAAELQDGDIICFQRFTKKGDKSVLGKEFDLGENKTSEENLLKSDRIEDAKEYYDFLHNKRSVKFVPHPTRCNALLYPAFDLVLSSKTYYDTLIERVGKHLGVDPTQIRLWRMNYTTGNPTAAVKRGINQDLHMILNPLGYNPLNSLQKSDAFYFEVLGISLGELDTLMKDIKIT